MKTITSTLLPSDESFNTQSDQYYYFYKTEQLTFLWILFLWILFGNLIVLFALRKSKNRKTRMNFFLMHLAIADLMVGLISVLTDIIWKTTVDFHGGNITCKLVKFSQVLVTYSSTYVLVSLSIDRYDAVTHPLNFCSRWKRAKLLIISAWIVSAILSIPAVLIFEEAVIKGHIQCWINLELNQWKLYITLVAITLFIIPAIIITSCYCKIISVIWDKNRLSNHIIPSIACKSDNKNVPNQDDKSQLKEAIYFSSSSKGIIPKAKIKTVKMTFVIVLVFILCWSPYFIWDLLQVYGFIPLNQTTLAISTFIQSMAPLNSAANPLIYGFFSSHMCKNIAKIFPLNCLHKFLCGSEAVWRRKVRSEKIDYSNINSSTTRSSSGTRDTKQFSLSQSSHSGSLDGLHIKKLAHQQEPETSKKLIKRMRSNSLDEHRLEKIIS